MKAIIFDLDDTLIKTQESKFIALQYAGKKFYSLDIKHETIKKHWGIAFEKFMEIIFEGKDKTQNIIKNYYSIRDNYPAKPYADAIEILNKLHQKYLLGIVSSAARRMVTGDLQILGFDLNLFYFIQTAEDTNFHKPDPRVMKPIIEKLKQRNIKEKETVFVGDSLVDYQAATDAGLQFIGIANRTTSKLDFDRYNTKTVNSLTELLDIL